LSGDTQVGLRVYNLRGQKVRILVDQYQTAREKQVIWDGTNQNSDKVASGISFYRLEVNGTGEVRRMVFLK
jgi:flagellar hook assembly protein FlgD